jgi:anti-sigma B factor antagonist
MDRAHGSGGERVIDGDVQLVPEGGGVRIRLSGAIDLSVSARVTAVAEQALARGPRAITVDLSDTTFLDSSGIGALVGLTNQASATGAPPVKLVAGPANVMRVLDIVGVTEVFDLTD